MNEEQIINIIGFAAAGFGVLSFVAQLRLSLKTHHMNDLSTRTILYVIIASILWIVYGYLIKGYPIIAINSLVLASQVFLLYLKFKFSREAKA